MGKRIVVMGLVVLALVLASSCGKDAKKAIDEAEIALNEARDAGAQDLASDEYRSAESLLASAREKYANKDYKGAKADAKSAKEQLELAKKRALERKAEQPPARPEEPSTAYNVPSIQGVPVTEKSKAVLQDVHFAFDSAELDELARQILLQNAQWLKANPEVKIQIEGHCDERGTEEYNLALGERRAKSVRDYLISLGISSSRISIISYGESMPLDPGHNEEAWAKNRRAHFVIQK